MTIGNQKIMTTIAVTGIAGYLGSSLLKLFDDDDQVERIVGIDIKEPQQSTSKLAFFRQDINEPFAEILADQAVDALIHLAFIVDPIHNTEQMHRVNVGGAANCLRACADAGVGNILMVSSATAYGAHPDNPPEFTEDMPLRGNADFPYAAHKVKVEYLCREYRTVHPNIRLTVARPAVVLGPNVDNFISRYINKLVVFTVAGYDPVMNFVHEHDIAPALVALLRDGSNEAYNIAGDGVMHLSKIVDAMGARTLPLPPGIAYRLTEFAWRLRLTFLTEAPGSLVKFIQYPWVVDNEKIKRALSFEFRYTTKEAVMSFVEAQR